MWEPEAEAQASADRAYAEALVAVEAAREHAEAVGRAAALRASAPAGADAAVPVTVPKAAAKAKAGGRAAPRQVAGPLPWPPSRQGRAYYVLRPAHPEGPSVSVGHQHTLAILGGSWVGSGGAPEGFADLASAINACLTLLPAGEHEVRIIFPPEARG